MINRIIGLYGNRCVGKDTFCKALQQVDTSIERYAFADSLKDDLYDFIREKWNKSIYELDSREKEKLRPLLIAYGMIRRTEDELYWVKRVLQDVARDKATNICITDVRFPNEHDYLSKEYGCKYTLFGLIRDGAPEGTDEEKKHEKEMAKRVDLWVDLPNVTDFSKLEIVAQESLINTQ
jgi:hypothetical protein